MMRSSGDDTSNRIAIQHTARRIVWSDALVRALAELRMRHPDASIELSALEHALADVTHSVESHLEAASSGARSVPSQRAGTTSRG